MTELKKIVYAVHTKIIIHTIISDRLTNLQIQSAISVTNQFKTDARYIARAQLEK